MTLPTSAHQVIETLAPMSAWEDRYRQLILWGKALPKMSVEKQCDEALVSGCEAKVWLYATREHEQWQFDIDANTRVVRGLIVLVLAAFNQQTSQQILAFDVDSYFERIGLLNQLTSSRANGLNAIVESIQAKAANT
ncbi:MAG: SufE family protein [Vibrio sp.]